MVLAAGLGERMRPLTDTCPKPLLKVADRTLLDHTLDRLESAGITDVVVNTHYLGEMIADHVSHRKTPRITLSPELDRLETGGGVKKALAHFQGDPFVVANSDTLLLNGPFNALKSMMAIWAPEKMDALLLLHSTVEAFGYEGKGDFLAEADGQLTRRPELELAPWLFTGVQILNPALFEGTPDGPFSLNLIYDKALESGRLFGIVHDGEWFHVGTLTGLDQAEAFMQLRYAGVEHRSS